MTDCVRTDMHSCGDDMRRPHYVTTTGEWWPKPAEDTMQTCHVLMAIDESGSMYPLADDVRGGFNQYIDDLKTDTETRYLVTLVRFATEVYPMCTATPLVDVPALTDENYKPRGGTALRDAIGELVTSYRGGSGDRVLVVVNTDGEENSSAEWSHKAIQDLVASKQADPQWGFVFLGASPDAWQQGQRWGMSSGQTLNTNSGYRSAYLSMSVNTTAYARGASAQSVAENVSRDSMEADDDDAN